LKEYSLPYGKDYLKLKIEEERIVNLLESHLEQYIPGKSQLEIVKDSLENPTGSKKLSELAAGKNNVVIIASDHTRPVPSKIIMPLMLQEIRKGNPDAKITILISTGCHRETTKEELIDKFGPEIVESEKIVVHDSLNSEVVYLGKLPSGGNLLINKIAVEADLLCSEGFIEPHFFAGFSGGRKSVLPGIASRTTVLANHCSRFIDSDNSRTGKLENNPIHADMLFGAKKAKLAFICNVIINSKKEVVYAVSGDVDSAHRKGVEFLRNYCEVKAPKTDIAISTNGGYPLDQNIYQAVKGMTAAEAAVRKDGVIIMLAKSEDGHGGKSFYEMFDNDKSLDQIYSEFMARNAEETVVDQWEAQILIRILKRARVIYISSCPDDMVRTFRMVPAQDLDEALSIAEKTVGKNSTVSIIPDGVSLMVKEPD
jgi:nickel-dependent lactate racemase